MKLNVGFSSPFPPRSSIFSPRLRVDLFEAMTIPFLRIQLSPVAPSLILEDTGLIAGRTKKRDAEARRSRRIAEKKDMILRSAGTSAHAAGQR
jgi:hypothetical protein